MATYYSNYSNEYRLRLDITQGTQSVANNTTVVSWTLYLLSGNKSMDVYSTYHATVNGVASPNTTQTNVTIGYNTSVTLGSGSTTVTHNADGTKSVAFSASFKTNSPVYSGGVLVSPGTMTISGTFALTTIPRSSTLTLSTTSQNIGSGITWTINESYDYTHKLAYYMGNTSGYILGSSSSASNTSTGTWTVPTSLANQMPNATSRSGTLKLYTFYGDVHVGTKEYTFTAKVPNTTTWQPSIPNVTITDAGTRPTGITSYVQGKAKANVVSSSTAQGGASIKSYRVTVSGLGTYYGSDITSGFLTKSGTVTITVRATDSRGYYRENVSTITVAAYSPPKMTIYTAKRSPNTQGTDLTAQLNFSISPVNNQNTKLYRIRYRPTGGTWITTAESTDYYTRNTGPVRTDVLDTDKSYEVEFYIEDSYTSVTQIRNIGTAFQLLDFNASGKGVAFGKVSENDSFEVAMPAEFTKGIAFLDTREAPATPESLPDRAMSFEFKTNSSVGNPPIVANNLYSHIINVAGWLTNEDSGGWPTQMSVSGDGLAVRQATSATTWGPWSKTAMMDSGSNANGTYIRFSDGVQICYHGNLPSSDNSTTGVTVTLPASFIDTAYSVNASARGVASATVAGSYVVESTPVTTAACRIKILVHKPATIDAPTTDPYFGYIAIGRWK